MTLPRGCALRLREFVPWLAPAVFQHKTTAGLCFTFSILRVMVRYDYFQGRSHQVAWNIHPLGNPSLA